MFYQILLTFCLCGLTMLGWSQNTTKERVLKEAADIFCGCEQTSKMALLSIAYQRQYISDEEAAEPLQLLQDQGRNCVGNMQTKMEEIEGDITSEDELYLLAAAKKTCPKTLEYTDVANGVTNLPLPNSLNKELNEKQAAAHFCSCNSLKELQKANEKIAKLSGMDKIEMAMNMAALRVQVMHEIASIRYTLTMLPEDKREAYQTKMEKKIGKKCPKLQTIYNQKRE
jgi:hypothetical protein